MEIVNPTGTELRHGFHRKWKNEQEYHVTTPVFTSDVNPGSPTFHFAFAAGDFWVDAVRVYEGDYIPSR